MGPATWDTTCEQLRRVRPGRPWSTSTKDTGKRVWAVVGWEAGKEASPAPHHVRRSLEHNGGLRRFPQPLSIHGLRAHLHHTCTKQSLSAPASGRTARTRMHMCKTDAAQAPADTRNGRHFCQQVCRATGTARMAMVVHMQVHRWIWSSDAVQQGPKPRACDGGGCSSSDVSGRGPGTVEVTVGRPWRRAAATARGSCGLPAWVSSANVCAASAVSPIVGTVPAASWCSNYRSTNCMFCRVCIPSLSGLMWVRLGENLFQRQVLFVPICPSACCIGAWVSSTSKPSGQCITMCL